MQNDEKNQNNILVSAEMLAELYERRMIVLLENASNENPGFSQILFNKEQFKKVSEAIRDCFPNQKDPENKNLDIVELCIDDKKPIPIEHFEGMKSSQ